MAEIVISEFMEQHAVEQLAAHFDVLYDKALVNDQERLLKEVQNCSALIVRNKTQVRGELLAKAAQLRCVGRLGVGLDNIDVAACKERSITVIPATGANSVSVAEYTLAGLLMLARGCYERSSEVKEGKWPRESMVGGEIFAKTLGLLGFGGIAREVAIRAQAFGMRCQAYDPFVANESPLWAQYHTTPVSLEQLLTTSDCVSIHVPLTDATRNLLNYERLSTMKDHALLINTARGGIVDEEALAKLLKDGKLGGAMLDVFSKEPLAADAPITTAPNCILTAHIAGVTKESNVRVSRMIAEKVAQALGGGK